MWLMIVGLDTDRETGCLACENIIRFVCVKSEIVDILMCLDHGEKAYATQQKAKYVGHTVIVINSAK